MGSHRTTTVSYRNDLHDKTMSLDTYTRYVPLHKAASFWGNYVSALKGNADLCAAPEPRVTHYYPSITETLPPVPRLHARVWQVGEPPVALAQGEFCRANQGS